MNKNCLFMNLFNNFCFKVRSLVQTGHRVDSQRGVRVIRDFKWPSTSSRFDPRPYPCQLLGNNVANDRRARQDIRARRCRPTHGDRVRHVSRWSREVSTSCCQESVVFLIRLVITNR